MRMDARSFVDVYFLQQLLKVFLKWNILFLSLSLCAQDTQGLSLMHSFL